MNHKGSYINHQDIFPKRIERNREMVPDQPLTQTVLWFPDHCVRRQWAAPRSVIVAPLGFLGIHITSQYRCKTDAQNLYYCYPHCYGCHRDQVRLQPFLPQGNTALCVYLVLSVCIVDHSESTMVILDKIWSGLAAREWYTTCLNAALRGAVEITVQFPVCIAVHPTTV